jgi:hypothetical protein
MHIADLKFGGADVEIRLSPEEERREGARSGVNIASPYHNANLSAGMSRVLRCAYDEGLALKRNGACGC